MSASFYYFQMLINFPKIILLHNSLAPTPNNFVLLQLTTLKTFITLWLLTFFIVFPKTSLFINFNKTKQKKWYWKSYFAFLLNSVFISMCGFNQVSWLNLNILCTFFKTKPWFNVCVKFFMCITYLFSLYNLVRSFPAFSIFICSDKEGKSL